MAHKQDNMAHAQLRGFFERIERLNEEIDALNNDKSQVYAEAKGQGFDVKIMRIVLSRRQMEPAEVQERDALVELYEDALRGGARATNKKAGTKNATRAGAGEAGKGGAS
ncbi:MAG: DUF2312 domain-containing protein [Parvibaculum sp.]|uniref:DUF2312 domain-containing protein n=1 Tax=Parvibaculum sp. TaxID=2024848 RepID=UPI002717E193|nr:DUF2312 domain-containing protein [Parvibaculum sp.]MDO8837990.1 DUF2312 domain-containing protein [Parvibaculum sp.]